MADKGKGKEKKSSKGKGKKGDPVCGGQAKNVDSGWESVQGRRFTMEDTVIEIPDMNERFDLGYDYQVALWGVFDGHGGKEAAMFAASNFGENLATHPSFNSDQSMPEVLTDTYRKTDKDLIVAGQAGKWVNGSTAAMCLLYKKKLWFSNIGDSEILLGVKKDGKVVLELGSVIHRPSEPEEEKRITQFGGKIRHGRIEGNVVTSRAFGDYEYKAPFNKAEGDYISVDPYVESRNLEDIDFAVLASDGLWDDVSKQKVFEICQAGFKANNGALKVSEALTKAALDANTKDNVTITVLRFL